MENKNIKFLEYLQVCGREMIKKEVFDDLRDKKCDFRRYYEFMTKYGEDFGDIVDNYCELTESITDHVKVYDKILDISEEMDNVHKRFISDKGTSEASRRLSCIGDELSLGKKDIINNWKNLSKLYVGPPKVKTGKRFYKMYPKTILDWDMTVMTFRHEKMKDKNIGAIIYKDGQELVYKMDRQEDIVNIASIIKKLKFEYDLVALAPCYTDIFYELEKYLIGKMSKRDFSGEAILMWWEEEDN